VAFYATLGDIQSAGYALCLYRRVVFGALTKPSLQGMLDLTPREIALFVPLLILTVLFGVWPGPVLETSANSVALVADRAQAAIGGLQKAAMLMGAH
jgi:NADH-quinone oxidoreductase subunit M